MHCNACATRIERALAEEQGVLSASVNLATNRAFVTYLAAEATPRDLCATVEGAGYGASEARRDEVSTRTGRHRPLGRAGGRLVAHRARGTGGGDARPPGRVWPDGSCSALAVVVEVAGGWPFLRASVRLVRHGATSMDTLIAVGTLAALAVSAVEAIALGGRHVHLGGGGEFAARLHGVMAPLIIAILVTGRAVEARARGSAARAMHSLMALRPPTARVVSDPDDAEGHLVPPESVPVGALVRVRPNEAIPLDGTVVSGWSAVDESMLTGRTAARRPRPGQPGHRGHAERRRARSSCGSTTIAAESVLARMQRLVEDAQRDKPPLQKLADRISAVFVPVVLVAAAVTFLAWWLLDGNFGTAVLSGVAVLLVACPCAMGLATPVAMMVGTGRASALGHPRPQRRGPGAPGPGRHGGLRQDRHPDRALRPRHRGGRRCPISADDDVLGLAAAVEAESEHPIAVAIRGAASPTARATESRRSPVRASSARWTAIVVAVGRLEGQSASRAPATAPSRPTRSAATRWWR